MKTVLLLLSACSLVLSQTPSNRPNVILIMADDLGYECIGCYGSKQYETPNIDRLASEGMQFQQCHSQPLCTPSRVKIMTGISNVRNYAAFSILRQDQKTIGHRFQAAGYSTAVAGKWQLLGAANYTKKFRGKGTSPKAAGFDRHCLWQVDKFGKRYWKPLLCIDGVNKQFEEDDDYGPTIVADYLIQFMATESKKKRPFFAYYPMVLPHNPFVPTPLSATGKKNPKLTKEQKQKRKQKNFEDMVAYVDHNVGRIVAATKQLGIEKNTLIIFCGDNGTNRTIHSKLNGKVIRGGKGTTTDAGTRVPMVAAWPGVVPAGKVLNDLVDFSDFLPTCLEAVGIETPKDIDGRSFWPQLQGQAGSPRESIFCYYCPRPERWAPIRFVRDKRWKLYGDGRFFDVIADNLEKSPLQGQLDQRPGARAARVRLQKALDTMPATGQVLLKFK